MQFPNPPLLVALLASVARHLAHGAGRRASLSIFYVALSAWAYEEARHGVNWLRRSLGVGMCVYIVVSLTHALRS
ncbi:MAG TPA: hypothetical protein VLJ42_06010 [Solirubrobacteraceae bacterium]|nr:hypothetical protein [Solirubrobacteraceae bacterium]